MSETEKVQPAIGKEEWVGIETYLRGSYVRAKFRLDEHEITVVREPVGEGARHLIVYIDGKFQLGWGSPDSDLYRPITERLWRKRTVYLYSHAKRKKLIKAFGKRRLRELIPNLEATFVSYQPLFPSSKSLVAKLRAIPELQVIEIGWTD